MGCGGSKAAKEEDFDASTAKWESNALLTTAYSQYTWAHMKSNKTTWVGEWRTGVDKAEGIGLASMLYSVQRDEPLPKTKNTSSSSAMRDAGFAAIDVATTVGSWVAPVDEVGNAFFAAGLASDVTEVATDVALGDDAAGGAAEGGNTKVPEYRLIAKGGQPSWKWCIANPEPNPKLIQTIP